MHNSSHAHEELIENATERMREQADAYERLESATAQLSTALVRGEPTVVESLTRAGEAELLRMRSRLLDITSLLTRVAEGRSPHTEHLPLNPERRADFESAARLLIDAAGSFYKVASRASNLALGGSSFASACVQACGVPPITYSPPVLKYYDGGPTR